MGVGARAVVGVVVIAALVGLGIGLLVNGGDDAEEPGSSEDAAASDEPESDGAVQEDDGELSEDEPTAGFAIDLSAGDALRVAVEGIDASMFLAVGDDALTDGFDDVLGNNEAARDDRQEHQEELFQSEGGDLVDGETLIVSTDRSSDDVEGLQFVAPGDGSFTVYVAGDEGSFDIVLEVEEGDSSALDPDEIEYLDYLATYGEHVDFFCDGDFFGGDPTDVTNYGPTVCDEDELAGTLSGQFNGDFTNDFAGGESAG